MMEEGGTPAAGRALRSRAASAIRHKVLSKIVTAATKQLEHIDDAFMPQLLRRVQFDDALEEVLRTALNADPSPAAKSPTITTIIPDENLEALSRAADRAALAKIELLKRVDMLTGAQMAERLGLTRATVDKRRVDRKLLALEVGSKRGFRYPAWQGDLVIDAQARVAFEQVLNALADEDLWSQYRFFTQAAPMLNGARPREAIQAGRGAAVLRAAQGWASGEQGGG